MKERKTEDDLCLAFAERVKASPEFARWLLSRTKFAQHAALARLLHEEQMTIRPRKFWWRHWWCHIPELKKDRETDIFLVFEAGPKKKRFALHIENKKDKGRFAEGQAEAYRVRAGHMAGKSQYLSYEDFETVLISPRAFRVKYALACGFFDSYISYEELSEFVPEFAQ